MRVGTSASAGSTCSQTWTPVRSNRSRYASFWSMLLNEMFVCFPPGEKKLSMHIVGKFIVPTIQTTAGPAPSKRDAIKLAELAQ